MFLAFFEHFVTKKRSSDAEKRTTATKSECRSTISCRGMPPWRDSTSFSGKQPWPWDRA